MRFLPGVLAVILLTVSGCSSPAASNDPGQGSADGMADASSSAIATPAGVATDSEFGSISGQVRDADKNPLAGVTVGVVSVAQRAVTDSRGEFLLDSLKPGSYLLRAQKEGYEPAATPLELAAGGRQHVGVVLAAIPPGESGPPRVDFWRGRDRVDVMDSAFTGEDDRLAQQCLAEGGAAGRDVRWEGPPVLRFDDPHQLVWPGTSAIDVVLAWEERSYSGDEMLVVWRWHPDADWQLSPMTPMGQVIRIEVQPGDADSPHQRFTGWQFAVCTKDQSDSTSDDQNHFAGEVNVRMALIRGHPLPVLGPEPDLWGNAMSLTLANETKRFTATDPTTDFYFPFGPCSGLASRAATAPIEQLDFSYVWEFGLSDGLLVPPGTQRIDVVLEWQYGAVVLGTSDLFMSYRDATVAPWEPADPSMESAPEPVAEGLGMRRYAFAVAPGAADGADDVETAWRFYWNIEGATPYCSRLDVHLVAKAFRS